MTGTSMDGIDISYISTDGINKVKILKEKSYQYSLYEQIKIKKINITNISKKSLINSHDVKITNLVIKYLKKFLKEFTIIKNGIDYISLSGQTILHIPNKNISLQLGNPTLISNFFKIQVISNFRINDIKNGGQGAPIGALYHKLLIKKILDFCELGWDPNCMKHEQNTKAIKAVPRARSLKSFFIALLYMPW